MPPRYGGGRSSQPLRPRASQTSPSSSRAGPSRGRASGAIGSSNRRNRRVQDDEDDEEEGEEQTEAAVSDDASGDGSAAAEDVEDLDDDREEDPELQVKKRIKMPVSDKIKEKCREIGKPELERRALDLVRLALFADYRRIPIRRDEITKKVLGKETSRVFPWIFNRAQGILRDTFCYELVEIRAKGTENQQLAAQTQPQTQAAASQKRRRDQDDEGGQDEASGSKGTGTKAYVLRSILPTAVLNALHEPANISGATHSQDDSAEASSSSAIDWNKADGQLGSMGLTFLILSLILLNGRSLPDDQFRALLHRLSLEKAAPLPDTLRPDSLRETQQSRGRDAAANTTSDSTAHPSTLKTFLDQLLKQGYLEKVQSNVPAGGRKARRTGEEEGQDNFEWKWGPRAEVEIGEVAVAEFVQSVYAHQDHEAGDEEEEEAGPSQSQHRRRSGATNGTQRRTGQTQSRHEKEKQSQLLRREIERAAGSQLIA